MTFLSSAICLLKSVYPGPCDILKCVPRQAFGSFFLMDCSQELFSWMQTQVWSSSQKSRSPLSWKAIANYTVSTSGLQRLFFLLGDWCFSGSGSFSSNINYSTVLSPVTRKPGELVSLLAVRGCSRGSYVPESRTLHSWWGGDELLALQHWHTAALRWCFPQGTLRLRGTGINVFKCQ